LKVDQSKVKNNMSELLLSICIPTYNRAPYLASLLARLSAEFTGVFAENIEIVVSDNASTDGTAEVCAVARDEFGLPLRYFRQSENIGASMSLNFAISQAHGRYFLYLADDDILFWPGVVKALRALVQNPAAVGLYAPWSMVDLVANTVGSQFYRHPDIRTFTSGDRAAFARFIVEHQVFSEIGIFRTDVWQLVAPKPTDIAYWAFTIPAQLLGIGELIYHTTPFYGSVTNHPGLARRVQAGNEEVQIGWDRYRGGIEHLIGLALDDLDLLAQADLRRLGERMVQVRMLVALRLRLVSKKDPVESYFLAARLRGLGVAHKLPRPMSYIRLAAAITDLTTRHAQAHGVTVLVLVGEFSPDEENAIDHLSQLPTLCFSAGLALEQRHLVLARGGILPDDIRNAGYWISEHNLMAQFV